MSPSIAQIPASRQPGSELSMDGVKKTPQKAAPLPSLTTRPDPCLLDSPSLRASDVMPESVIHEEDEETASEMAEPITPTSDAQPPEFPQHVGKKDLDARSVEHPIARGPLIVNTMATPPPKSSSNSTERTSPTESATTRPSPLKSASRSMRTIFRVQSSHSTYRESIAAEDGSISPRESKESSRGSFLTSIRKGSFSSPSRNSPGSSQSNSPRSPGSPTSTLNSNANATLGVSPPETSFVKKQFRSSTGLSLRDRSKVVFGSTPKPTRPSQKIRSPSMGDIQNQPERPGFSIPAASGVGLKSRRMSATLPDDFTVDSCELNDEFVPASKFPGRRGKEIGKGSTATVTIMLRKGGNKERCYAVKEFRKCGQKEDKAEYEKKVKSEFSIANSLHHPNIIETVMLCTHRGRWNHVMEYCSYGEMFTLVQKKYLTKEDNLCIFKQLLRGVSHLHENGIAHRDIKLENLLMTEEGHLKITDFGVSEVFSGIHPGLRSSGGKCGKDMGDVRLCSPGVCGSMPYIAPEVLTTKADYDPRPLDVWSCGIVFMTLFHRGNPWPEARTKCSNFAKFETGWNKYLTTHPDGLIGEDDGPKCGPAFSLLPNPALRRLMLRMLNPNPAKRISIHEALSDRWIKTVECCLKDPRELDQVVTEIDVANRGCTKLAGKMVVQKMHNHLPPEKRRMPQHRFDMGHGW